MATDIQTNIIRIKNNYYKVIESSTSIESSTIPGLGELIIYPDTDGTGYVNAKIGDGTTTLANLPWIGYTQEYIEKQILAGEW